jgi:hypothetical protein|tara:strand:+ start:300 stop:542 length:243 start_codon:yes stop_codon:yes gene_type:complete
VGLPLIRWVKYLASFSQPIIDIIFLVEIVKQAIVVRKKYVDGAKDEIKHPRDWPKIYAYVLVIGAGGENGTWKFYRNEKD